MRTLRRSRAPSAARAHPAPLTRTLRRSRVPCAARACPPPLARALHRSRAPCAARARPPPLTRVLCRSPDFPQAIQPPGGYQTPAFLLREPAALSPKREAWGSRAQQPPRRGAAAGMGHSARALCGQSWPGGARPAAVFQPGNRNRPSHACRKPQNASGIG